MKEELASSVAELHPIEIAKKSGKHFGHSYIDDEPRNKTELAFTSGNAEDRSKELTNHGQPSFHEGKEFPSKFLPKASLVARAKFETDTNTLNVTIGDCSVVLCGRLNTEQVSSNLFCDRDRLQSENGQKETDYNDPCKRRKGARVECQQQVFNKGEVISDSGLKGADKILNQTATGLVDCRVRKAQNNENAHSGETIMARVELPMALINVKGVLSGKDPQCELLLEQVEVCQDNGNFDEHDSLVAKAMHLYEERKNVDMLLILEIEQAAPLSYKGHRKLAKKKLISVIQSDLKSQVLHPNIITARAYYLLAAHMRRKKDRRTIKFGLILECLRRSECLLQNYDSPEDLSELYQTYGSVWLDLMGQIPNAERNARARDAEGEKAKYYFAKAIYFSKQDHRLRVQIKRQMYAHYKLATKFLDSSSTFALAQEKPIPPSDIKEAVEHLENICKFKDSIPNATLMLFYKSQADLYTRLGQYQLAKERADDAYRLACLHHFNTELEPLQKRKDFLEMKLQALDQTVNEVQDQSSSDSGYRISGSDSQ